MQSISVSTRGRVVIPKSVRLRLGIEAGSRLELTEAGDEWILRVAKRPEKTSAGRQS